ncbi:MAG: hypothetical protein ACR2K6_09695 [Solirubrobacterales bacterium]
MPALPLDDAGTYVAAAYTVFLVLLAIYVGIMAAKLGRISREIGELADLVERRNAAEPSPGSPDAAARSDADSERTTPIASPSHGLPSEPASGRQPSTAPIQEERW